MIGVFGGTFDPVHHGHLRAAVEVLDVFALDEVRLIPSATPPHRVQPVASAIQRRDMLARAVDGHPKLVVDNRELERVGPSYMVDTLASLRQDFIGQPLLLYIGTDAFNHLSRWHRWQALFTYAHIVVMTRPGFVLQALEPFFAERLVSHQQDLQHTLAGKLFFQSITQLDISATAIRNQFANGKNPVFLLPDAVIEYIQCNGLYGSR